MTCDRARNRAFNLDTVDDTAWGAPRTESEEHIIEMKGLGAGSMDYVKMADGSETASWAQSDGAVNSNKGVKRFQIIKITEVTVKNEGNSHVIV